MDHKLDILCKKFVLIGHYALMLGNRSQYTKVTNNKNMVTEVNIQK